jgi:hypothetical protein
MDALSGSHASVRRFRVVTVKANQRRVLFSKHETREAAEAMVAALAKSKCPAHVEVAGDDDARPGEAL